VLSMGWLYHVVVLPFLCIYLSIASLVAEVGVLVGDLVL